MQMQYSDNLGIIGSLLLATQRRRHYYRFSTPRKPFRLASKYARHPLLARPGSSDLDIFDQIFCQREYAAIDDVDDVKLIIDCGAYIGYSGAYLLTQFPESRLIAVEADATNFEMLKRNLTPYEHRARLIHAGIWSHETHLTIDDRAYRSGRHCTRQVRECLASESGGIPAIDIGTLLRQSGHDRIDILKMDIEGAECMVFSQNCEDWLSRTRVIAIELHDDTHFGQASEIFKRACGDQFTFSTFGELTFAWHS